MKTIEQLKNDKKLYTEKEAVEVLKGLRLLSPDTNYLFEELDFEWVDCFETCDGDIKEYHIYEDNTYYSWEETINLEVAELDNGLEVFSIYGSDSDCSCFDRCISFNSETINTRFDELADLYKAKTIEDYKNELKSILGVDNISIYVINERYDVSINWIGKLYKYLDIETITADYIDILDASVSKIDTVIESLGSGAENEYRCFDELLDILETAGFCRYDFYKIHSCSNFSIVIFDNKNNKIKNLNKENILDFSKTVKELVQNKIKNLEK